MTNGTTEIRKTVVRADCTMNGHRYHSTWTPGHLLCTGCGKRAVCPVCVPQMPNTTQQLVLCAKHRPKEEPQ